MEIKRLSSKLIALLLSITFLLQSCSVYQNKTISLERAIKTKRKVKIHTNTGDVYKFQKIIEKEGQFYGIIKEKENWFEFGDRTLFVGNNIEKYKIPIESESIKEIHPKNWPISTLINIVSIATIIPFLAILGIESVEFD